MSERQTPPADQAMSADDALEWLRQRLTEDNFPFFNRHPHHTTSETWAMWAERDVLAEIEAIRDALRQAPPADLREQVYRVVMGTRHQSARNATDAVLVVVRERERLLRERIEALTMHHAAESGLGAMLRRRDVLAEIDRHAW